MTTEIKYINPIKIIHKYKNNNRRTQYMQYIFIGSLVDPEIHSILESIKKKTLYDSINLLSKNKLEKLASVYGEEWFQSFFNRYHIIDQFNNINKNITKKNIIETKMGKSILLKYTNIIMHKKVEYSFAANYYDYLIARNKIKTQTRKAEMDFRTYNINKNIIQLGGMDNMDDIEMGIKDMDFKEKILDDEDDEEEQLQTVEDMDDEIVEDFDLDELTKFYSMDIVESDKSIRDTTKLISEAINDKKFLKTADKVEIKFDNSMEDTTYDIKLEDVYEKYYILDQFIYMDDTIKNIRNKISVSIPLHEKFGEEIKILPEYQYFWTEYNLKNTIDYVMLGQKWIRKNELVKIDIKPNENLSVYENLRNNLSYLKDSFGIKIKREDDENNILRDYEDYMLNNEIYMLDIMNELGLNYNIEAESKRNIYEVYINIYFPLIPFERFDDLIMLLNNSNNKEIERNINQYNIIRNDTRLEKEIYTIVDEIKLKENSYNKYFEENHIIQSIIHINLNNIKNITGTVSQDKFNLYKIFDNFNVNEEYPFMQYMTSDSQLRYKFYTKMKKLEDTSIITKWFENSSYGISFKIKVKNIEDKYLSINMSETGRLEYKITWKEENEATIDDIKKSYIYVNDLISKINNENNKIKIILPTDDMFKYAFINTIQKFNIPEKFKINHNDLSDFSRFFYTYVSLVIEPKKRVSTITKDEVFSKFGTYLRYKRISNYENKTKMHLRILYFLRNFDISNKELIDEIAKQFNITNESAILELDTVKVKYKKILSKTKKKLRSLKTMPRSKPPGIGIDIQGRNSDNYKIRITGARSKEQLNEILAFVKVLIYLYVETYLLKTPKYQKLKDILLKLNKIAKRRNKVNEFVKYDNENVIKVKQITGLDKKRLGFKPEEGQNQWTRSCQNSGDDKKRRPLIVSSDNVKDLLKRGYKMNTKTNTYEKTSIISANGKKKEITVKAIKLNDEGGTYNYFTCDPDENAEHSYIGFLSKSNNPNDLCMPCCFKKDQGTSNNKKKKNYYMKCIGQKIKEDVNESHVGLGDKLYILQDTNKIQDGRFIFLPKYLNHFFNTVWKHDYVIKNHYLTHSNSGYFFKYTVKNNNYFFLSAIAHIYDMTVETIIERMISTLTNDTHDMIFTSLNNGDIRTLFKDRDSYIKYLKNSAYIEYDMVGELLSIPNILSKKGIIYYIFDKKIKVIKKNLEKDEYIENYYLQCLNIENHPYIDMDRDIVILINDGKYYFPIYMVRKNKTDSKIVLQKIFNNNNMMNKIINEITHYYRMSCINNFIYNINNNYNITPKILDKIGINIKKQIIDDRNKVRYIVTDENMIIPTTPSGSILNCPIINIHNIKQSDLLDLDTMIKLLKKFNNMLNDKLAKNDNITFDYIPKTLLYNMNKNSEYNVTSIYLVNNMIIPIKNIMMKPIQFKKYGLGYNFQPMEEMIDVEISNNNNINDKRNINVKNRIYRNEAYNLFRLELSIFLSNNNEIKKTITNIVRNKNINKINKKKELLDIIFKLIENKIKKNQFIDIIKELPELTNYKVSNVREYCKINRTKDKCNNNLHCKYIDNNCMFIMYKNDIIFNINKIVEEMIIDGIKFKEIIQEDTYYVSDIVDYTQYSDRPNQKIIKASNFNLKKIMTELFGKDSIPIIGKKKISKLEINIEENYPEILEIGNQLIQPIICNKDSIIRAYINCYYWIHNKLYDKESRNLKYHSELQDTLTYLFKANIIDYIFNNVNKELTNDINKLYNISKQESISNETKNIKNAMNQFRKNSYNTDGKIELTVLSYIFPYPIIVYNNFNNIIYIYSNGIVDVNEKTIKKYTNENDRFKTISLKFEYEGNNKIPTTIESIYYL